MTNKIRISKILVSLDNFDVSLCLKCENGVKAKTNKTSYLSLSVLFGQNAYDCKVTAKAIERYFLKIYSIHFKRKKILPTMQPVKKTIFSNKYYNKSTLVFQVYMPHCLFE